MNILENTPTFSDILLSQELLIELNVFQQTVVRQSFTGSFGFAQQQTEKHTIGEQKSGLQQNHLPRCKHFISLRQGFLLFGTTALHKSNVMIHTAQTSVYVRQSFKSIRRFDFAKNYHLHL